MVIKVLAYTGISLVLRFYLNLYIDCVHTTEYNCVKYYNLLLSLNEVKIIFLISILDEYFTHFSGLLIPSSVKFYITELY